MALTYPCSFYVVRHVLYSLFHRGRQYVSIQQAPRWKHLAFTLPLFFVSLGMSLFITQLGIVMSLSGSIGMSI